MKTEIISLTLSLVLVWPSSNARAHDAAAGEISFKKCQLCHAIGDGAKNKVGPQLNGLNGRAAGTAADYSFSEATKNSGVTWNEGSFTDFIKDPRGRLPGTKMPFAGIKNATEIGDLWSYVAQFDAKGVKK